MAAFFRKLLLVNSQAGEEEDEVLYKNENEKYTSSMNADIKV